VTRKINSILNKYLPEQRLYLRTDVNTRFLRLTPGTQAALILGSAVFFGWTILATSVFLVDALGPSAVSTVARVQQMDFETRLKRLSDERDKRALEAQKAQERFYVALKQVSAQQSMLLASEDQRRELQTGLDVVQGTLRKAMKDRDRATRQSDKLLAELQAATGNSTTVATSAKDAEETLDFISAALQVTANQRDIARSTSQKMRDKVSKLKYKAKLTTERNQRIFSRLEDAVTASITPLKKMFKKLGLSSDKLIKDVRAGYSGIGGPLMPIAVAPAGQPKDATSVEANKLLSEMDTVNLLRIAAERTPLAMPIHSTYRLTSPFGYRIHPVTKRRAMHEGTDLAAPRGTPLYATADGVVAFAGLSNGYGKLIKIRHAMGFETRFGHLSRIRVKKGQRVSRGDRIGDVGSTGRSTGPHVHYEIRIGGKPVNPMTYIKAARNVF